MQSKKYECEIGGKKVVANFTDLAEQANGSVLLSCEGTVILATAVISKDGKSNPGFFNLTVEYLEKFYASGKILGGQYNHREGRPSDNAVLGSRMIDRTIRPLFEHHIKNAVQVITTVIAIGDMDPKVLAINSASIALSVSSIPWDGPVGAVHVSRARGESEMKINNYIPANDESVYDMDLLVCGREGTINMIEATGKEINEDDMGSAFDLAVIEIKKWEEFQNTIKKEIGKEKISFPKEEISTEDKKTFEEVILTTLKEKLISLESKAVSHQLETQWKEILKEKYVDDVAKIFAGEDYFHSVLDDMFHHEAIQNQKRADGRALNEVRGLYAQAGGISDSLHGSGIFYRGETHVLSVATLGGPEAMLAIEGVESSCKKRFMHHYNFPPYSCGETGRLGGINRREMGHGFLAEKALIPVLPEKTIFPYTIRVVSESVASNGSTSQASICASTIALLDAGVPITSPVAGISIGLMQDTNDKNKYVLLTDIQGPEDHYGDMDFKVGGTHNGITAIQMDVKVGGVSPSILKEALAQAKTARLQILETIKKEIPEARKDISPRAPRIEIVKINKDQIGLVIGPGGKNINAIREETGTEITIEEDGTVYITGLSVGAKKAKQIIADMTHEYKVGDTMEARVVKLMDFGAFVAFGGGNEGLVHISEIAPFRVERVSDILKEGDMVPVKIIKLDEKGRLNLSIKEANPEFFKPKASL